MAGEPEVGHCAALVGDESIRLLALRARTPEIATALVADLARRFPSRSMLLLNEPEESPLCPWLEALGFEERPLVLFVGALGNQRKGYDLLHEAWRDLCRDPAFDAVLAVVGEGADRRTWERRAVAEGLSWRIRFLGQRRDVPRLLAASDLLVHPARYDAYALSVHEALGSGVPVVVSETSGVSERIPDGDEFMILGAPLAAGPLADRLREWRRKADRWTARAQALAPSIRARTWDDMAVEIRDSILEEA